MTSLLVGLVLSLNTDFTFVRHGETIANATGRYNEKNLNELSDKGKNQVVALTAKLVKEPRYDMIVASPAPRVLKTIAPYLKATHQKATIWPLLYECCTGKRPSGAHATSFTYGAKVTVPQDLKPYFIVVPGDKVPAPVDYNAGLAQVAECVRKFKVECVGKRVLVVGHSAHGGKFIQALAGKVMKVENATPYRFSVAGSR